MTAWHDGRLIGFDLETTGVDLEEARIVTAALVIVGGGEPTERLTWIADPGVPIPDEAAAVHGITTERAQAEGRPAGEVVREVLDALVVAGVAVRPLVDFNARFDLTVLDRERARHGADHPPLGAWERLRVVDPLVLDKWLHRYRKGSRKLDAMCAHYGATLDGAHDAAYDALAGCRLAWAIAKRGQVIRRVRDAGERAELIALRRQWAAIRDDLDALHVAQIAIAREQAQGLAAYFREQGNPDADRVETAWPIVPEPEPDDGRYLRCAGCGWMLPLATTAVGERCPQCEGELIVAREVPA